MEVIEADIFKVTTDNFLKLKDDLKQMVDKTIGSDSSSILSKFMGTDPKKVVNCVKAKMTSKGLKAHTFNMNGDKLDSPIIDMAETNPEMFSILSECGFLTHVGGIISITSWVINSSDKSKENLILFLSCNDRINWSDINTWKNISNDKSPISACVK